MPITGPVHHVGLTVADLERSVAFYTAHLGCEVVASQEKRGGYLAAIVGYPGAHVRMTHLRAPGGDLVIELFQYLDPDPVTRPLEPRAVGLTHLCLLVTDLAEVHARLADAGVDFLSAPTAVDTGVNAGGAGLYLRDPDGAIIELFQRPVTGAEPAA